MTVNEYISGKFKTFGIELSESDLLDILMSSGTDGDSQFTERISMAINVGIARFIPQLLMRPTKISESGFSISWEIDGLKAYYAYLCKLYGLDDILSEKPSVTFL